MDDEDELEVDAEAPLLEPSEELALVVAEGDEDSEDVSESETTPTDGSESPTKVEAEAEAEPASLAPTLPLPLPLEDEDEDLEGVGVGVGVGVAVIVALSSTTVTLRNAIYSVPLTLSVESPGSVTLPTMMYVPVAVNLKLYAHRSLVPSESYAPVWSVVEPTVVGVIDVAQFVPERQAFIHESSTLPGSPVAVSMALGKMLLVTAEFLNDDQVMLMESLRWIVVAEAAMDTPTGQRPTLSALRLGKASAFEPESDVMPSQ